MKYMVILTSIQGTNAELFKNAFTIFGKSAKEILDVTYGKGIFWKNIDVSNLNITRNDLDELRGDTSYHSSNLPDEWTDKFDFSVYDPPYMHSQKYGTVKKSISATYNNNKSKLNTMEDIRKAYQEAGKELYRVTKHKGYVAVKCMDTIESGKQRRLHIWIWEDFLNMGFRDEDLLTLMPNSTPTIRWQNQKHARKNISYLWIFKVWK